MKKILYFLLIALCCISCDTDDDFIKQSFTWNDLDGEWLCYDEENGSSAIEMSFLSKGMSYKATAYTDIQNTMNVYDSQYGYYAFLKTTNSLRINVASQTTGRQYTVDYELVDANRYALKLRSKKLNCIDTYYKLVDTKEITFGEAFSMDFSKEADFNPTTFETVNQNIATVDASGMITACGIGTTYVIAKDSDKRLVTKIVVKSYVLDHAAEISESIDDVIDKYGEPQVTGSASATSDAILYKQPAWNPSVMAMQYNYDKTTRMVTRLLVQYQSKEAFENDAKWIAKNFNQVEFGIIYYCDTDDFFTSKIHILPFEKNGIYYVSYGNTAYYFTNGHY